MLKNKAGLVALIVLVIATVLMIFFVMPNLRGIKDQPTAETPAVDVARPADTSAADAKGARPTPSTQTETAEKPADATAQPTTDANPAETAAADPTAGWTIPGFDVLRVEPDGSTVIAGKAQPGTKLEIMNGDTVIATADVGSSGDFAAVFDKPLAAGDYQLTLRSVGEGGASKTSQEVATVSIPKDGAGELLAMVSKPGEASRIITTPDAKPSDETQASTGVRPAGSASTQAAATDVAKTEPADNATVPTPATGAADTATNSASPATTQAEMPVDADTANTAAAATPAASAATGKSEVAVSAVEIEGRKVFVAGSAKPGSLVRIYADDVLVGQIKADDQGRFVVDGTLDLAVGNHTIRADMLSADGSKVEFRASVPFDRPEGDQVAAVAQPDASGTMVSFDGGSFDGLRAEAGKALALLKGLFEGGKVPNAEQLAAARSATEIALNSLANFKVSGTLDASISEVAAKTSAAASEALALLKAVPKDAASVSAALDKIEAAVGSALMPRTDGAGASATDTTPSVAVTPAQDTATAKPGETPESVTTQPATTSTEQATKPAAQAQTATGSQSTEGAAASATAGSDQSATEPETVQQAPLKQSKSSVIIRRGDTLWQISRRVYGAGVRYTTIYLANEDQISDPNRILPGQVFGVPDEAMSEQESEALHRKRLEQKP